MAPAYSRNEGLNALEEALDMKIQPSILALAVLAAPLALAAADDQKPTDKKDPHAMHDMHAMATAGRAVAVLQGGGGVAGTVWFKPAAGGVQVSARITGLTPGAHGFHVHEFGDCSAADFTSAGGHFNPMGQPHGAPDASARHVGDLGNIQAGADGVATLDWTDKELAFDGKHGVVGRAVIVHAKADDLKTQPTGDAGGRVACGVIGVAKAE
jgi:Cu-Zn family superoxide dismutase